MIKTEKSFGKIYEIWPEDNYFVLMQELEPGDELVFHEGTYGDVFRLLRSGLPEKPIVIRGFGGREKRPVIDFWLRTAPIEIYASNLVIDNFDFTTHREGNFIHIRGGGQDRRSDNVTIQNCIFRNSPSVVIDCNTPGVKCNNLRILNNIFLDIDYTCIYIGSHDGDSPASNVLIEGNYIDLSRVNNPEIIGYGMELKLNVIRSVVRNNIVINSQGPGIMVYGTTTGDPADANTVEGNLVAGARNSAGILAGGGPSKVRNNLIVGCRGGGVQVYNYGRRNLVENITVTNNTIACVKHAGMNFYEIDKAQYITAENNLLISNSKIPDVIGSLNANPNWKVSGNGNISADTDLERLVDNLKETNLSNPDNLQKAIPLLQYLENGPLSLEETKELLREVIAAFK